MRVADDFVHVTLLRAKRAADWPCARQVAAVAKVLIASVHEHQVAVVRQLHSRQLQHAVQELPYRSRTGPLKSTKMAENIGNMLKPSGQPIPHTSIKCQ